MGGTTTRIAAFSTIGDTAFTTLARFPTSQDHAAQMAKLTETLRTAFTSDVKGIALACGFQLTKDGNSCDIAYTLPGYMGKPIVPPLAEAFPCKVVAANDNVCAVIAESHLGSLREYARGAYMTVSTGTGAGVRLCQGTMAVAFFAQVG